MIDGDVFKKQFGLFEKELILFKFHFGRCAPFRFLDHLDDVFLCQLEQEWMDTQPVGSAFSGDGLHSCDGMCLQKGEYALPVLQFMVHWAVCNTWDVAHNLFTPFTG